MNVTTEQRVELWSARLRNRLRGPLSLDASPRRMGTMQVSLQTPSPDSFLDFIPLPAEAAQLVPADDPRASINEPEPNWSPM